MKERKTVFQGVATALITPFNENGVDYEKFGKLIDWQIESGVNALVVCGTTGESSTLTDDEHRDTIAYAVKKVNGRVPVIAGAGSNDTVYALDLARCACEAGADALLCVTPYYNKGTQSGLIKMFTQIADYSTVPIILYNVPSRTGINIEPSTYLALSDHPNIAGIKEASGNISKLMDTMSLVGDKLDLYSGNDDQVLPVLALGGKGVISVLSNVVPKKTVEMCDRFFRGDVKGCAALQYEMLPLIHALFSEVNPIPVKSAMHVMGFCDNNIRLPLTELEEKNKKVLFEEMRKNGVAF